MIDRVQHLHQLWRHFGPGWLAYRARYATRMRMGFVRRSMPAMDWDAQPLRGFLSDSRLADPQSYLDYRRNRAPAFFFAPSCRAQYQHHFADWDKQSVTPSSLSEEIAQGRMRYFEHTIAHTGFPPDWHVNPFTGERAPADIHWSQIGDFGHGDIKIIWEASRFGFAYALVRAYWRTGHERYAEMFWLLVEDWRAHNPPQQGANWKCGQETSFRVMAWCYGLYGLLDSKATTAERVSSLAHMIVVSGRRIEANLDYALSQRSNHGISEGTGLWTIGALFPEFSSSEKWRDAGREVLESHGLELIYEDGAFSQHSVNYERLMLHDYLWALRLGEILDQPFSTELGERVRKAGEFLFQIQDETSGRVPYYGQNDGALILPLNNCDYQDFRPVIQSTHYLSSRTRCYESGPWDEDLLWLFGPAALETPLAVEARADLRADSGGYYTLRSDDGFVFTRAASFRHRPGQADMLHVDLWWRGQNIATDAGTFSYNAPAHWNNPLAHTAYHNTVTVDGQDQMNRAGKFLWLPWACGRARAYHNSQSGHLSYWEGEHDGYERLAAPARHRRAILRLGEHWLVLDELKSAEKHSYRLHWLLLDADYEWDEEAARLKLKTSEGAYYLQVGTPNGPGVFSLVRADESSPRGWRAPYYNYREPALSVELIAQQSSLVFYSLFGPDPCDVTANETTLQVIATQWRATIRMQADEEHKALIASARVAGPLEDWLETA